MTERTWQIKVWDGKRLVPMTVTLAEYRAMVDASSAKARAIHAENVRKIAALTR